MRLEAVVLFLVVALLAVAVVTLPIVPCALPKDVWSETDFAKVKKEMDAVKGRLTGLYLNLSNEVLQKVDRYNLVAKHGTVRKYRAVLGAWTIGWSREGTWAFGVPGLPNMPHVLLDAKKETFQVTPDTLKDFLAWAQTAQVDATTGLYLVEAPASSSSPGDN